MAWRPLSKRGQADPRLDEPVEGLPPYLRDPVFRWVARAVARDVDDGIYEKRVSHFELLRALQLSFRLPESLDFSGDMTAATDLLGRMNADETFALDAVDYLLANILTATPPYHDPAGFATELNDLLEAGGSVWEVSIIEPHRQRFQLNRRAIGPVREAIADLPTASRAHQHLVAAWNHLSSRNPDPSGTYRESVRAVEAAAKPIVLPTNDRATMGQMIAAIRAKPEKWTTTLGTPSDIQRCMENVWTGQLDRHGTDDESIPLNVSQKEADAAFYACLALARTFAGGHMSLA